MAQTFLATCPKGVEPLLVDELKSLGASQVVQLAVGVEFSGELEIAYRACLWSRVANRILLPLLKGRAESADELYQGVQSINWSEHMSPSSSLAISFTGSSRAITNTHFGTLKVKDAIVDQLRQVGGERPSIERDTPDIRVHTHLYRGALSVSLDLSGSSLHRRGYRLHAGTAPLKENLAAAILLRAGWRKAEFTQLYDPLCGSGTLLIEAAMMSMDIAPGLDREHWGFSCWKQHDAALWTRLLAEAEKRRALGTSQNTAKFIGGDIDARVLERAAENARNVGLEQYIEFRTGDVEKMRPPHQGGGLLVTNPPYGERLGDSSMLMFMYRAIGDTLKRDFRGWQASIFTGNPELCEVVGLKPDKVYKLNNGPIESKLFNYTIYAERTDADSEQAEAPPQALSEAGQMFANRLQKNLKGLAKWRKKNSIDAYRLYDADIPEYAVAIDVYGDWVHVQEYAAPKSIDQVKVFERLKDVMAAIPQVLQISAKRVVLKQRKRQSGTQQYEKHGHLGKFFEVQEHGCKLRINLKDYLDTGLFLDHRPIRLEIQQQAQGKDFLNLFSYTASASVHAAVGGAKSTTSVDMSATYLAWASKNMARNGYNDSQHHFIQADCLQWLKKQRQPAYDLIFMDPPTFSNSKRMQDVMDVQRDHVRMLSAAMRLLRRDGVLIFSNNYRKFKMDYELLSAFDIKEITPRTIDMDFKRNAKIHQCFELRHKS
ncbi:MAG: bifunctional 23S rRNA (guanine(2069)-N(7))-methyltransferase RlmK/23S rRNA (guanine(2445)-N(2))-methyltransferase RlmL [Pseudomonadales bacterium]